MRAMGAQRFDEGASRRLCLRNGICAACACAWGCVRPVPYASTAAAPPRPTPAAEPDAVTLDAAMPDARPESTESSPEATSDRPLMRRYPTLAAALPFVDLGGLPTAVTREAGLGQRLGLERLLVKHDGAAGREYGGSKARKLEHLLGDALARSAGGTVMTSGGVGSNHALATAVHVRRLGLGCLLLLAAEPPSEHAREHLLAEHELGCRLHAGRAASRSDVQRVLSRQPLGPSSVYVIPQGGSSELGNVGYVNAAFELAEQVEQQGLPVPDVIYIAAGTLGAAAGLYVGLRAVGLPTTTVAVRASNPGLGNMRNLRAAILTTSSYLHGLSSDFPTVAPEPSLLRLEHRFVGDGYARPTAAGRAARDLVRDAAQIELDLTYTAKAFAALTHDASRLTGQTVLFWNTYDSRTVPSGDSSPQDLPSAFRGYFR